MGSERVSALAQGKPIPWELLTPQAVPDGVSDLLPVIPFLPLARWEMRQAIMALLLELQTYALTWEHVRSLGDSNDPWDARLYERHQTHLRGLEQSIGAKATSMLSSMVSDHPSVLAAPRYQMIREFLQGVGDAAGAGLLREGPATSAACLAEMRQAAMEVSSAGIGRWPRGPVGRMHWRLSPGPADPQAPDGCSAGSRPTDVACQSQSPSRHTSRARGGPAGGCTFSLTRFEIPVRGVYVLYTFCIRFWTPAERPKTAPWHRAFAPGRFPGRVRFPCIFSQPTGPIMRVIGSRSA